MLFYLVNFFNCTTTLIMIGAMKSRELLLFLWT